MVVTFVHFAGNFLKRSKGASRYANTLTINFDGLQIYTLATASRDVGVATGVTVEGGFSAKLADARHR